MAPMRWAILLVPAAASSPAPSASVAPIPCPPETIAVEGGSYFDTHEKASVTIAAHCLDRTEVTAASYAACVKKGKCTAADAWNDGENKYCNAGREARKDDPINCVDHVQAE